MALDGRRLWPDAEDAVAGLVDAAEGCGTLLLALARGSQDLDGGTRRALTLVGALLVDEARSASLAALGELR